MPASLLPLIISAAALASAIIGVLASVNGRRVLAVKWLTGAVCGLAGPPVICLLIGGLLWCGSMLGSSRLQFTYARWLESTPDLLQAVSLVPMSFRKEESLYWLEQAANSKDAEAMYALGRKLKFGLCLPEGAENPTRGQKLMDDAITAGFVAAVPENEYYSRQFRIHLP